MKSITDKEVQANAEKYNEVVAKCCGTLHERMKFLMKMLKKQGKLSYEVVQAAYDLELEVAGTTPAGPPIGHRRVKLVRRAGIRYHLKAE